MKKRIRYGTYTMSKRTISICLITLLVISLFTINVSATETNSHEETTSTVTTPSSKDSSDKVKTEKETVASYTEPSTEAKEKISTKKSKIKTGTSVKKVQTGDASGTCGTNLIWSFSTETGTLIISGTGAMNNYSTSSSNNAPWYSYRTSIKNIIIENGVTSIGAYAFYSCSYLESLSIADSVTAINSNAFYSCTKAGFCGDNCIWVYNSSATTLTISAIGGTGTMNSYSTKSSNRAPWYSYRTSIKNIIIENGVTSIGAYAFYSCTNLKTITIPDSVGSIAATAFASCNYIGSCGTGCVWIYNPSDTTLTIKGGGIMNSYSSANGSRAPWYTYSNSITDVFIEDGVMSISAYAFYNCTALTNINIPDSITSVASTAFKGCTNVGVCGTNSIWTYNSSDTTLKISGTGKIDTVAWDSFASKITNLVIGSGITDIGNIFSTYGSPTCNYSNLENISVDENNETYYSIDGNLYQKASNNSVFLVRYAPAKTDSAFQIPKNITTIESCAFYNCTALTDISIPDSVKTINNSAFYSCTNLKSIIIPDSVTSIGNQAFSYCKRLTEITIGAGVKQLSGGFKECYLLKKVYITDLTSWCNISFSDGNSNPLSYAHHLYLDDELITELTIPDTIKTIKQYAFYKCTALTKLTIPDTVQTIKDYAFYGCTGLTNISIPDSVNFIGDYTFAECKNLGNVVIGGNSNLSTIGNNAFENSVLNEIPTYPSGCSVGTDAFKTNNVNWSYNESTDTLTISGTGAVTKGDWYYLYGASIKKVIIKDGIDCIANSAFSGCEALTSVTIPSSVTSIGDYAFYECTALESVTIPEGVTTINRSAFSWCTSLTDIAIPNSVTSIGYSAFYYCKIKNVYITDLISWCNISFENYASNPMRSTYSETVNLFIDNQLLTELTIPQEVTSINSYTFGNLSLKNITLEDNSNLQSINASSFYKCGNLKSLQDKIPESCTVSNTAFDNCFFDSGACGSNLTWNFNSNTGTLTISGSGNMYNYDQTNIPWLCYRDYISNIILEDGITSIGEDAFKDCVNVTNITIPEGVTSIGIYAFENTGITSINIPGSVTSIDNRAFDRCLNLSRITVDSNNTNYDSRNNCNSIVVTSTNRLIVGSNNSTIPEGINAIDISAFWGRTGLTTINIPGSVTSIDNRAFEQCPALMNITVDSNNTKYDSRNNCNALIETFTNKLIAGSGNSTIPYGVTSIGYGAFSGRTGLTDITIPDSVTSIEGCAFWNCTSLKKLTIPDSVQTLHTNYMKGCTALTSVIFNNRLTTISSSTFEGCTKLMSVKIPNSVKTIEFDAFRGCSALTSINIPDSVTSIQTSAFYGCTSLTNIIIPESITSISDKTFFGCTNLLSVIIGNEVTTIGSGAFAGCSQANIVVSNNVSNIGTNAFNKCNMVICPMDSYVYNLLTSYNFLTFRNAGTTPVGIVTAKYQLNQLLKGKSKNSNSTTSSKTKLLTGYSNSKKKTGSGNKVLEEIIEENLSNVECYVVEDLKIENTLNFDKNLNVTLHLNEVETDNEGNVVVDSVGNIVDGEAHTISGSNDEALIEVPGNLTITTTKEASGGIINDNGDLFDVKNNGNLKIENGTYSEDVSEYIANDKVISKTNNRYTVVNPTTKDLSLEDDGHEMIMPNNQNTFSRNEFLGVQIRRASERNYFNEGDLSIHTVAVEEAMRFVSVIRTDILRGAEDYGYVLVKGRNYDNMKSRQNDIYSGSDGCVTVSLKGTKNTLANTPYSSKNLDEGKYKYLTAAVHHIDDDNTAIGARFYIKRLDGTYVYSDYTCISTMGKLKAMAA